MLADIKNINENNILLSFKVSKDNFEKAVSDVFIETRHKYKIVGMETGMIPKCIIESQYGETVFYTDAVNYLIEKEFDNMNNTYKNHKITRDKVSDINILQIGKNTDLIFELLINI